MSTSNVTKKPEDELWLAVASKEVPTEETLGDMYGMKVGGHPVWVYPGVRAQHSLRCRVCQAELLLLTQIYAPLGDYDRVLYILGCRNNNCKSFLALRAQRFVAPEDGVVGEGGNVVGETFKEDDDWGDDEEVQQEQQQQEDEEEVAAVVDIFANIEPLHDVRTPAFPATILHPLSEAEATAAYEARVRKEMANVKVEEADAATMNDPMINPEYEKGTEEDDDKNTARYFKHMDKCKNQVVRWQPNGKQLLIKTEEIPEPAPCPLCGGARHFEMQLLSTAVYLINGSSDDGLSFGTLLMYTCKDPACGAGVYAEEVIHLQEGM
eukprot:PhM_4_TR10997/c0_g2_i1/m.80903/K14801/TSR4; pre-rRNA-processing protein TSR4